MEKSQLGVSGHKVILVASGVDVPLLARRDQLLLKDYKKLTIKMYLLKVLHLHEHLQQLLQACSAPLPAQLLPAQKEKTSSILRRAVSVSIVRPACSHLIPGILDQGQQLIRLARHGWSGPRPPTIYKPMVPRDPNTSSTTMEVLPLDHPTPVVVEVSPNWPRSCLPIARWVHL